METQHLGNQNTPTPPQTKLLTFSQEQMCQTLFCAPAESEPIRILFCESSLDGGSNIFFQILHAWAKKSI